MEIDVKASREYLEARFRRQFDEREARRLAALEIIRAAIHAAAPAFPAVRRIYLFGSVLSPGHFRLDSDIDIGIEGELDGRDYYALWRKLDDSAPGWDIDLVELDRARVHFADRVRSEGELVYAT